MKNQKLLLFLLMIGCLALGAIAQQSSVYSLNTAFEFDQANSGFASSIDMDGNTAVARCLSCAGGARAIVLEKINDQWQQVAELTASRPQAGETLAQAVAIDGDVIVLTNRKGRAYVYEKPAGGWMDMTQTATLQLDPGILKTNANGSYVAISENIIAFSDLNAVTQESEPPYVAIFEKTTSTWQNLTSSTVISLPVKSIPIGWGISIHQNTIMIGQRSTDVGGTIGLIYEKQSNVWERKAEMIVSNAFVTDNVKLTSNYAYISGRGKSVRIYEKPVGGWAGTLSPSATLSANPTQQSFFGFRMDATDNYVLVGDRNENMASLYIRPTTGWVNAEPDTLINPGGFVAGDRFSQGVAINDDGDMLISADRIDRGGLTDVGGMYFYDLIRAQGATNTNIFGLRGGFMPNGFFIYNEEGKFTQNTGQTSVGSRNPLLASDGRIYGISGGGVQGEGFIYKINPDGSGFTKLFDFNSQSGTGAFPEALKEGQDGMLYGATSGTGNGSIKATIFKIDKNGSNFTTLKTLNGTTESDVISEIHLGSDGIIRGFVRDGLFKMNIDGSGYAILPSTSKYGRGLSSCVEYNNFIYGVYSNGGNPDEVYKWNMQTDVITVIHTFTDADVSNTNAGLTLAAGKLYGVTASSDPLSHPDEYGFIYEIDPINDQFRVTNAVFSGTGSNGVQKSEMTFDGDKYLYGFQLKQGANGKGTIFRYDITSGGLFDQTFYEFPANVNDFNLGYSTGAPVIFYNAAPRINRDMSSVTFSGKEDVSGFSIDTNGLFSDLDEDDSDLTITITENGTSLLQNFTEINGVFTTSNVQDQYGTGTLTIRATDKHGGSSSQVVNFEIEPTVDIASITAAKAAKYYTFNTGGLVITKNPVDGVEVTHFEISAITDGELYLNDGTTRVNDGDFITTSEAGLGLKFLPTNVGNVSFSFRSSIGAISSEQSGSITTNIIADKAPLSVTANDQAITFGDALPALDGTLIGVVNNDNITVTYATTATATSDVGTYPITITLSDPDGRLGNYDVSETQGTLTIQKALGVHNPKVKIFPNPASNYFMLKGIEFDKLEIYNLEGRKLLESTHPRVEIGSLDAGLHLIRLYKDRKVIHEQKIVVN